jgi:hypothetical protein
MSRGCRICAATTLASVAGASRAGRDRTLTNVSSEQIATPAEPVGAPEPCRGCGAPLAEDQRYCLECGERRTPMSSVLLGAPPSAPPGGSPSAHPPGQGSPAPGEQRGSAATAIAGVGVLLLAIGVGVLIGRSGGRPASPAAPQVISVSSAPATGTSAPAAQSATFSNDWPSGKSGYTVRLQTLAVAGTQTSVVEAAKAAASAKGAKAVGALNSEDFSSLPTGEYVIYSGVYDKRAEAQMAAGHLKKSFPGAKVVKVASGAGTSSGSSGGAAGSSGIGATPSHPAPPAAVESLKKATKGKSYEEQSKKLPNVISTG